MKGGICMAKVDFHICFNLSERRINELTKEIAQKEQELANLKNQRSVPMRTGSDTVDMCKYIDAYYRSLDL